MAVQLASHSLPMDSRLPDARELNPCVVREDGGRFGMGRVAVG